MTPTRPGRNRPAEYATTLVEVVIVATSLVYVLTGSLAALFVWEGVAMLYLIVGFVISWRRSRMGVEDAAGRTGALDTLSWVLPLAASMAGINSAILALATGAAGQTSDRINVTLAVAASLGIVLSWHLLHTGFAQIYESSQHRAPDEPGLSFVGRSNPTFVDFLYFSFTIGTSFATSDTTVNTSRTRWTVLVHSVISFFYNALVVAVAFQLIQQLVRT